MKNAILAVLILFVLGCANEDEFSVEPDFIQDSITIESGMLLTYHVGNFPIEGGITIHQQPDHYQLSELDKAEMGGLEYRYRPEAGFTGTDYVEIKLASSSGGSKIEFISIIQLTIIVE